MKSTLLAGAALALVACSGGGSSSSAPSTTAAPQRPSVAEMERRAPIVADALALPLADDADVTTLTCILDDPWDSFGYQAGMKGQSPSITVAASVIACAESEWPLLAKAISTALGVDVAGISTRVATATAGL